MAILPMVLVLGGRKMKKWLSLFALVAVACVVTWGCQKPEESTTDESNGPVGEGVEQVALAYCGLCGGEKGPNHACDQDAAKCDSCGLVKGSALCCVALSDDAKGKDLCGKCGQIAGSDACCQPDVEVCSKCQLVKGSPLCCKLKKEAATDKPDDGSGDK